MNGVINFLKPPGMSSNGAVVFLRGLLGVKKAGHAGTLDPGACGVLPICVGKATKISSYMMGSIKEYIAEVTFGRRTDTGDSYGSVVEFSQDAPPDADTVKNALKQFCGRTTQLTPIYSAVKQDGQKLYKLARKGVEVKRRQREIVIDEIEYLRQTAPDAHLIRVVCGKGTYIRALCEDIGKSLSLPAYMSFLVRTRCAGLSLAEAVTADELKALGGEYPGALLPIDTFLKNLPRKVVSAAYEKILLNGGTLSYDAGDAEAVRIYIGDTLYGIGSIRGGQMKITTLLVGRQ